MLKEILKEKKISTSRLAKDINEPYSTINDLVNGKVNIGDCKAKILKELSEYLEQTMEETYEQCNLTLQIYSTEYDIIGNISVRCKKYYVEFSYEKTTYEIEIAKVTEATTTFIKEVALYEMEKLIKQKTMEKYICNMK